MESLLVPGVAVASFDQEIKRVILHVAVREALV
jgi:hypothetical protein